MKLRKLGKDKRGLGLNDIYGIVMIIGIVAILLAIVIYVLLSVGDQMDTIDNGSAASNVTSDVIDDFVDFVPWIGVILLVVAAAIVLGIVIRSFAVRRGGV